MAHINEKGQYVTDHGSAIDYIGVDEPLDGHIAEVIYAGDADKPETETSYNGPDGLRHEVVDEELVREHWTKLGKQYPAPHPHAKLLAELGAPGFGADEAGGRGSVTAGAPQPQST